MTTLVDWDVAARAARRFSPKPPSVSRQQADDTVTELYQAAARAADHVAQLTHLDEPQVTAATRVVDRGGWIDAITTDPPCEPRVTTLSSFVLTF